ncbi:hypothetical protein [Actinacidiphila paucisporea]|uniref:CDP-Glycerol:Poly(Glycerophosphate) glycerophosphotransferase n=1 Tax=Actinacidiphila paucisporea TaxID=310782 RepID=A0A1M6YRB0_9ACTN|nr:hypothetical protein [Actinacidiphila paucisporea]SHL20559.1 hypothetical protein SAMN05216499_10384 [Actinacidiphila paucisporea]
MPDAGTRQYLTVVGCKRVLVVAHTITYVRRLLDVLPLLDGDFRVQVVFTAPPHVFGDEVPALLARLGCAVVPWDEAVRMEFDLALAAGRLGVEELRAPLITMPHGAAYLKRVVGTRDPGVAGMRRVDLMPGGRLPAAVVLPHRAELRELRRNCPEAVPRAEVVGDPVHDRITASLPLRPAFRRALGLSDGRKLVVAASTWGPWSSFSRFDALLPRLMGELPRDTHRVAVLMHPNIWSGHGAWQIRSWMARCRQAGIALVPPEVDWRSVLIAADVVIGDHGSVTLYGTLTEAALLLAGPPAQEVNPASPAAALALAVPALSPGHPLLEQLEYAAAERRDGERDSGRAAVATRITSEPGLFARKMRALMYRVMGLGGPAHPPVTRLLPEPPGWDRLVWGTERESA